MLKKVVVALFFTISIFCQTSTSWTDTSINEMFHKPVYVGPGIYFIKDMVIKSTNHKLILPRVCRRAEKQLYL